MVICGCLQENYGKADKDCVAKVKELYKALNLEVILPTFNTVIKKLGTKTECVWKFKN